MTAENSFPTGKPNISFSEVKIWDECPYKHEIPNYNPNNK